MTKEPDEYTFTIKGKKAVVRDPGFKELQLGLSAMTTMTGNVDLVGAGKAIFDTCKVKCDPAIEKDPQLLMSLCLKLSEQFIEPVDVEVKKN